MSQIDYASTYKVIIDELSKCDDNRTTQFIIELLEENISLEEVADRYMLYMDYDGNCMGCTTSGLFDAFYQYKSNTCYDPIDASYLASRSGILGQYMIDPDNIIFVTVKQLISQCDGDGFQQWLCEQANS